MGEMASPVTDDPDDHKIGRAEEAAGRFYGVNSGGIRTIYMGVGDKADPQAGGFGQSCMDNVGPARSTTIRRPYAKPSSDAAACVDKDEFI